MQEKIFSKNKKVVVYGKIRKIRRRKQFIFLDIQCFSKIIQVIIEKKNVQLATLKISTNLQYDDNVEIKGTFVYGNDLFDIFAWSIKILTSETNTRKIVRQDTRKKTGVCSGQDIAVLQMKNSLIAETEKWLVLNGFAKTNVPIVSPIPLYFGEMILGRELHERDYIINQPLVFFPEIQLAGFDRVYNKLSVASDDTGSYCRNIVEVFKMEMLLGESNEIIVACEELVNFLIKRCSMEYQDFFAELGINAIHARKKQAPYPRIFRKEAVSYLQKKGKRIECGDDFNRDDQRMLFKFFGKRPFWIIRETDEFFVSRFGNRITFLAELYSGSGDGSLISVMEKSYDFSVLHRKAQDKICEDWKRRRIKELSCLQERFYGSFGFGIEKMICWLLKIYPRDLNRNFY